jgi:hypothetical protein
MVVRGDSHLVRGGVDLEKNVAATDGRSRACRRASCVPGFGPRPQSIERLTLDASAASTRPKLGPFPQVLGQ